MRIKAPGFRLSAASTVKFSPTGRFLGQAGRHVGVYDVAQRRLSVRSQWHYPHPAFVAFGAKDEWFAVRSTTGALVVADIITGEPMSRLAPPPAAASEAADDSPLHSAPGNHLVETCSSGTLRVRHIDGLRVEYVEQHPEFMLGPAAASTDQRTWALSLKRKHSDKPTGQRSRIELRTWPFTTGTRKVLREHDTWVHEVVLAPSADRVAVLEQGRGEAEMRLSVIQTATGEVVSEARSQAWKAAFYCMDWSPDGSWFIVGTSAGHELLDGSLRTIGHLNGEYASDVEFSPDGSLVALGYWSSGVVLPTADLRAWFTDERPVSIEPAV